MNKDILTANAQKIFVSLLAIATVGFTPLAAKADEAIVMDSYQESYTTGVGNIAVQNSRQLNQQRSDYRGRYGSYRSRRDNVGIVQKSHQICDQVGDYNDCIQNSEQINSRRTRRSRW